MQLKVVDNDLRKRQAVALVSLLPRDRDEAIALLDLAREMVDPTFIKNDDGSTPPRSH